MAIFRCNGCSHIREVGNHYLGRPVKCPKCKEVANVHDTTTFVKAVVKSLVAQRAELEALRSKTDNVDSMPKPAVLEQSIFTDVDVNNTNILAHESNLLPISEWFSRRQITVEFNPDASDTTGFFDEIALQMGQEYELLSKVSQHIKYIQNKGYSNVKIDVSDYASHELEKVKHFCDALYDYSFVAKSFYQKKAQCIRLTLQTAPKIRDFFNGLWMEWFVLITILQYLESKNVAAACVRSLLVTFQSGASNELDLFLVAKDGSPMCIECKTGEFRHDIDKYLGLRKQLGLTKQQFILCVFGLSTEQAVGMTSMYDLTFVNEHTLMDHLTPVLELA